MNGRKLSSSNYYGMADNAIPHLWFGFAQKTFPFSHFPSLVRLQVHCKSLWKETKKKRVKNRKIDSESSPRSESVRTADVRRLPHRSYITSQAGKRKLSYQRRGETRSHALWSRKISDTHRARCIKFVATIKKYFFLSDSRFLLKINERMSTGRTEWKSFQKFIHPRSSRAASANIYF